MTKQRNDTHSTEFGLWIRNYGPDSRIDAINITNLDYIIYNYATGDIMLLEEKRYGTTPKFWQKNIFELLHKVFILACKNGIKVKVKDNLMKPLKYYGMHLVVFENTSPEDGWIKLDNKFITKERFMLFLNFGKEYSKICELANTS